MKFWDSSAIVTLLVEQAFTEVALKLYQQDDNMLVWWGSRVECDSALARLERDGALGADDIQQALKRLDALDASAQQIQPCEPIRSVARRLLRTHPLRAGDALQLAAAYVASENFPSSLEFVCFDNCLALAAAKEGFVVFQGSAEK